MSSGSKKRAKRKRAEKAGARSSCPRAVPELSAWQTAALRHVGSSSLAKELVFGGGAALSAVHLHHRSSEDLDFFLQRMVETADLASITKALTKEGAIVTEQALGPRRSLLLGTADKLYGKIDFAYYPYDPIDRPTVWEGLRVESLRDMTVNKVQAIATRFQARDYVDLWFLLREGPETDLDRLLGLVRAKFDAGVDRFALAHRFLMVSEVEELPRMIRPVSKDELVAFFEGLAKSLVRSR